MINKLALLLLILATISIISDARMPQPGDYVQIAFAANPSDLCIGNVTDIGNGLICVHSVFGDIDVCIGTGQIETLTWPPRPPKFPKI